MGDVSLLRCNTKDWQRDSGREVDISTDLSRGLQLSLYQFLCTILYSPSPCVSPPFSSIAMEKPCWCTYLTTVQMHLFEKENLDISGINWQPVSLFDCIHCQKYCCLWPTYSVWYRCTTKQLQRQQMYFYLFNSFLCIYVSLYKLQGISIYSVRFFYSYVSYCNTGLGCPFPSCSPKSLMNCTYIWKRNWSLGRSA